MTSLVTCWSWWQSKSGLKSLSNSAATAICFFCKYLDAKDDIVSTVESTSDDIYSYRISI